MQYIPGETLTIDRKARVNMPFYDLDLRPPQERIGPIPLLGRQHQIWRHTIGV